MNQMRRTDRELTTEEACAVLAAGEYGTLATVCEDGQPYAVPVNYAFADNTIYIHGTKGLSQRNINMNANSRVCFTVTGRTEVLPAEFGTKFESAVVIGTARVSEQPAKGLMLLVDKYSPEFKQEGAEYIDKAIAATLVYEITIERITGKGRR